MSAICLNTEQIYSKLPPEALSIGKGALKCLHTCISLDSHEQFSSVCLGHVDLVEPVHATFFRWVRYAFVVFIPNGFVILQNIACKVHAFIDRGDLYVWNSAISRYQPNDTIVIHTIDNIPYVLNIIDVISKMEYKR